MLVLVAWLFLCFLYGYNVFYHYVLPIISYWSEHKASCHHQRSRCAYCMWVLIVCGHSWMQSHQYWVKYLSHSHTQQQSMSHLQHNTSRIDCFFDQIGCLCRSVMSELVSKNNLKQNNFPDQNMAELLGCFVIKYFNWCDKWFV